MHEVLPTTILFVDDDAAWRVVLDRWFRGLGLRSIGLARGEWITHAIEQYQPDVLLLDIHLPGRDGLHVLEDVRRRWPTLPVVVMTAFGGKQTADLARHVGATGYLDKPFRMDELTDELRRVVGRSGDEPPCA
jgi:two-component system nitrogen regulation response regulator GlnG